MKSIRADPRNHAAEGDERRDPRDTLRHSLSTSWMPAKPMEEALAALALVDNLVAEAERAVQFLHWDRRPELEAALVPFVAAGRRSEAAHGDGDESA